MHKEVKLGQPAIDILEINRLRRQLLFQSYVWDQRLIHAVSSTNNNQGDAVGSVIAKFKDNPVGSSEKFVDKSGKGFSSLDSHPDTLSDTHYNQGLSSDTGGGFGVNEEKGMDPDLNIRNEVGQCLSSSDRVCNNSEGLESGKGARQVLSEGEFSIITSLSDTLDAAWTGENQPLNLAAKENGSSAHPILSTVVNPVAANAKDNGAELTRVSSTKGTDNNESSKSWVGMPFLSFYNSFNKSLSLNTQKLAVSEYTPTYVLSFRELERQSGARLLLPVGINDTVVPVYDDEPTSIIAYALVSPEYHAQISEYEAPKETVDPSVSAMLFDSVNLLSVNSVDETSESYKSFGGSSVDESFMSTSSSRSSLVLDPLSYTKDLHARISFTDDSPLGKAKYTVTCYYAKRFDALRKICCPSELDFIRSLSRCKKWGAQGGKSNVFFAKTSDERFVIKQVTKTELESFIKFGPAYFKYLSESISTGSPTCLAKILGIYQVLFSTLLFKWISLCIRNYMLI